MMTDLGQQKKAEKLRRKEAKRIEREERNKILSLENKCFWTRPWGHMYIYKHTGGGFYSAKCKFCPKIK